jgi:hypothetical protein
MNRSFRQNTLKDNLSDELHFETNLLTDESGHTNMVASANHKSRVNTVHIQTAHPNIATPPCEKVLDHSMDGGANVFLLHLSCIFSQPSFDMICKNVIIHF